MSEKPEAFEDVEARARKSRGTSADAIYAMVLREFQSIGTRGGVIADVGCGAGLFEPVAKRLFDRYLGVDAVRYETFPAGADFRSCNLDREPIPLETGSMDAVAAIETIEHLENPRAFVRELVRICKPGGWIAVTTPNQVSLLSKLTLVTKNCFNAFQDGQYPAHITALLEVDLVRIAKENGLVEVRTAFSENGRLALTAARVPGFLSRSMPRAFSDNIMMLGRKPAG